MSYKITYLDAKGLIGVENCGGTFLQAQAIAEKAIATRMADQIEVRDETGTIVFRLPKGNRRG